MNFKEGEVIFEKDSLDIIWINKITKRCYYGFKLNTQGLMYSKSDRRITIKLGDECYNLHPCSNDYYKEYWDTMKRCQFEVEMEEIINEIQKRRSGLLY